MSVCTSLLFPHMYAVKQHSSACRYDLSASRFIPKTSFCDTTYLFEANSYFLSASGFFNFTFTRFVFCTTQQTQPHTNLKGAVIV